MVPAVGKLTVADQSAPLTLPFPPAPSQPLAQRKVVTDPGSEATLWLPPPFLNVTVSPALMLKLFGEKLMLESAVTMWSAADAVVENIRESAIAGPRATAAAWP